MLLFLSLFFALDTDPYYYIETLEGQRLILEKDSVRIMKKEEIEKKKKSIIQKVLLIGNNRENEYKIFFTGGHYLSKKPAGKGLVTTIDGEKASKWTFEGDKIFQIKLENKCLTMKGFDTKLNGNVVRVSECKDGEIQKFQLVEVTEENKKPAVEEPKAAVEEPKPIIERDLHAIMRKHHYFHHNSHIFDEDSHMHDEDFHYHGHHLHAMEHDPHFMSGETHFRRRAPLLNPSLQGDLDLKELEIINQEDPLDKSMSPIAEKYKDMEEQRKLWNY